MSALDTRFYKANYGGELTLVRLQDGKFEMLIIRDGVHHWIRNVVPMSLMIRTSEVEAMDWLDGITRHG